MSEDGTPIKPSSITLWWRYHGEPDYGTDRTLHELRHTFITRLARKGVQPRVVQVLAGHRNLSTTLSVYTHVSGEEKRNAVDLL